jgi:hypothetical protein
VISIEENKIRCGYETCREGCVFKKKFRINEVKADAIAIQLMKDFEVVGSIQSNIIDFVKGSLQRKYP